MQGALTLQIMSKSWNAVMSVYLSPYFSKFMSIFSKSVKAIGCQSSHIEAPVIPYIFYMFIEGHLTIMLVHSSTGLLMEWTNYVE